MTKKSFYNSIIRGSLVPLENWVKALMLIFSHVIYFPFFLLLQSYKFLMLIHNCRNKSYNTYFLTNNFFFNYNYTFYSLFSLFVKFFYDPKNISRDFT